MNIMSEPYEITASPSRSEDVREILTQARRIAVVGLSDNPQRDSHQVALYLQEKGYKILPVNLLAKQILGEKSYASLREVPPPVDIVNIFRKPDAVPGIVDDAVEIGARCVWMQLGIVHQAAADKARAAGLKVVMDRCILVEHRERIDSLLKPTSF